MKNTSTCGRTRRGTIQELWYHASGCRSWLTVTRDTRTHAVAGALLAMETRP